MYEEHLGDVHGLVELLLRALEEDEEESRQDY